MKTKPVVLGLLLGAAGLLQSGRAAHVQSLAPEFHSALRSGDNRALRGLLERGAGRDARDAQGNTPLMLAAVYGDVEAMRLLLQQGAAVNVTNAAGATPLMRAACDYAKTRLLVDRGADVNARSASGNTPLLLAARVANSHRTVALLLSRGADPNAANRSGATPLMAAAAGGDAGSVKLLLKHGANPNAQPTPDEAGFLFGGGRSALMWAAFRGDTTIVKLLLQAGADVNAVNGLGTALSQAAWADRLETARALIDAGAQPNLAGPVDGYSALHWAASTDDSDTSLLKLLLAHGADPNLEGGQDVDAFMGTAQTPLMLSRRRGETELVKLLLASGATNETPDLKRDVPRPTRAGSVDPDAGTLRAAIERAIVPLQDTSIESKRAFLNHSSRQDCTSCHQQFLPMAAAGFARNFGAAVDAGKHRELVEIVRQGEMKDPEVDWQPLFHPDAVQTKGYELFAYAHANLSADANSDAWVHHLAAIQGPDGRWYNNLPRPPLQTGDIGATALGIHALQRYPLPGRNEEFARRVEHARKWLWSARPDNTDSRIYQLLGLAWAGEPPQKLDRLRQELLAEQRADGGWSQLPHLESDAYATGQAIYALRIAAKMNRSDPAIERGLRYLLGTQLVDGTWYVRRRAFPFQPTMNSGFPHGRDSWISAAGTSWAVLALSLTDPEEMIAGR